MRIPTLVHASILNTTRHRSATLPTPTTPLIPSTLPPQYEEVMQEEIECMREAYEARLKKSTDAMSELRRRHGIEMKAAREKAQRRR